MGALEKIISSVVEITRHKEEYVLAESLVKTVHQMLQVNLIFLLETSQVQEEGETSTRSSVIALAGRDLEGLAENKLRLPEATAEIFSPLLDLSIKERKTQQLALKDSCVWTLPIENNDQIGYVLCIQHDSMSVDDNRIVIGMVEIFRNYLLILDEGKHDTLTGLLNRKVFLERINRTIHLSQCELSQFSGGENRRDGQEEGSYWLAIFDIDHFKKVNDTFGHIYGDEVLITFSRLMRECFRANDLLFRYGGEEFVAVIGTMNESVAESVFERFRETIESNHFGRLQQVTVSIGMVEVQAGDDPTTMVGHADQALYYAKEHGRNQISVYGRLVRERLIHKPDTKDDFELF